MSQSTQEIGSYWLLDEEDSFCQEYEKYKLFKTQQSASTPHSASSSSSLSSPPFNITFGLKCLLLEIEQQQSLSEEERRSLKLQIIESKMVRSKWFRIDRIGQEKLYEEMDKILYDLRNYTPYSLPFLTRVSKKDAPDYFDIIANPMDFSTMYKKLKGCAYNSKREFVNDLNLLYSNCYEYNTDPNSALRLYVDCLRERWIPLLANIPDIVIQGKNEVFAYLGGNPFEPFESSASATPSTKSIKWMFPVCNSFPHLYWEYLQQRKSRLSSMPFSEQPAIIRKGELMGAFEEDEAQAFFSNSFPPSSCLAQPHCLYKQWNVLSCTSESFLRYLGKQSYFPTKNKPACLQLVHNIKNINMLRILLSKIEFIRSSTEFCKTSLLNDPLAQISPDILNDSFVQRRSRPYDLKYDVAIMMKRFICLICANVGFQSVQSSSLDILFDSIYGYLCNLCKCLSFVFNDLMPAESMEINLTVVCRTFLQLAQIDLRDVIQFYKQSIQKYPKRLAAAASSLQTQYENLLKPEQDISDDEIEKDDFFITGEIEGDDLGLDMLGLKELGLPSVIPRSLLKGTSDCVTE